jgi:hypothetical protein
MDFLNILHKIGTGAAVAEHVAIPVASIFLPQFAAPLGQVDAVVQRVMGGIVTVEQMQPAATGEVKQAAVVTDFQGYITGLQAMIPGGKTLTYDQAELKLAIDAQVSAFRHFAAVKASIKVA